MFKVNTILNLYPNLLQTEEIKLTEKPKRKEFIKWSENNDKRFNEALNYPIEKLNLDVLYYEFCHVLDDKTKVNFDIIMDRCSEQCVINSHSDGVLNDAQQKEIQNIHRDIDIFKGVSQYDIEHRTPRFMGYAMNFMES